MATKEEGLSRWQQKEPGGATGAGTTTAVSSQDKGLCTWQDCQASSFQAGRGCLSREARGQPGTCGTCPGAGMEGRLPQASSNTSEVVAFCVTWHDNSVALAVAGSDYSERCFYLAGAGGPGWGGEDRGAQLEQKAGWIPWMQSGAEIRGWISTSATGSCPPSRPGCSPLSLPPYTPASYFGGRRGEGAAPSISSSVAGQGRRLSVL